MSNRVKLVSGDRGCGKSQFLLERARADFFFDPSIVKRLGKPAGVMGEVSSAPTPMAYVSSRNRGSFVPNLAGATLNVVTNEADLTLLRYVALRFNTPNMFSGVNVDAWVESARPLLLLPFIEAMQAYDPSYLYVNDLDGVFYYNGKPCLFVDAPASLVSAAQVIIEIISYAVIFGYDGSRQPIRDFPGHIYIDDLELHQSETEGYPCKLLSLLLELFPLARFVIATSSPSLLQAYGGDLIAFLPDNRLDSAQKEAKPHHPKGV